MTSECGNQCERCECERKQSPAENNKTGRQVIQDTVEAIADAIIVGLEVIVSGSDS